MTRTLTALLALSLVAPCALAQDNRPIVPREVIAPHDTGYTITNEQQIPPAVSAPASADASLLMPELEAILIVNKPGEIIPTGLRGEGLSIMDHNPLLGAPELREELKTYIGKPLKLADLRRMAARITEYFRTHDRPAVDVIIPEQNVSYGLLQLAVVEFKVGEVRVEGNEHFSDELLRQRLGLAPGAPVSAQAIRESLDWINNNPYRNVDMVLQPGEAPGTTDLVLRTKDEMPIGVYTGVENTGTKSTGETHYLAGFNWGNLFGLDHRLAYQYTSSDDVLKGVSAENPGPSFRGHALSYMIPLTPRDTLNFYGAYTEAAPGVGQNFSLIGRSWQISSRYEHQLNNEADFQQVVIGGADFKRTNNDFEFGGVTIADNYTDVLQGVMGWRGAKRDAHGLSQLQATLNLSPGNLTAYNGDGDYQPANTRGGRPFANSTYAYLLLDGERLTRLPDELTWRTKLQAQFSSTNLIASEQFGLGGANSIRGYAEREVNGDHGLLISNELRSQAWSFLENDADQLQALAFLDLGYTVLNKADVGEKSDYFLASVGPGIRYTIGNNLVLRADYGWQLHDTGVTDDNQRFHFALQLTY